MLLHLFRKNRTSGKRMSRRIVTTAAILGLVLGPSLIGAPQERDPIKVGAIFARTGKAMSSNVHLFEAVRYAVKEINENGGVLGRPLKVVEIDNHSSPIKAKLAARKAVKENVAAVVGCSWSDHSIAAARVLQEAGIPMISPDSTSPELTKIGDYIFRMCYTDPFQGRALASFARNDLEAEKAGIIQCITSTYSMGLAQSFKNVFERQGGEIVAQKSYKDREQDFSSVLQELKAYDMDVMFIPGHGESGVIVKKAREMGITCPMMGGDGWGYKEFFSSGGVWLEEGYYTTYWSPRIDSPRTEDFVNSYGRNHRINDNAPFAYDAVMLLADAVRRAGSVKGEDIRNALSETEDFVGVTGGADFDKYGDPRKPAVIMKISNGKKKFHSLIRPQEQKPQQ